MRRAYILITVPAAIVGVFYVVVFHWAGLQVSFVPFIGAGGVFIAALLLVRRYQRRKMRKTGS